MISDSSKVPAIHAYVSIFRDYFDQATPPLLKSLKDCLTAFVALGSETWDPIKRHELSISISNDVFCGAIMTDFRKGDLYLLEFLTKKRWLTSQSLLTADPGKTSAIVNLESLFKVMRSRTLAPSMGKLLTTLLQRLKEELAMIAGKAALKELWLLYFKKELATALLSTDEQIALNAELHVVSGVFHNEAEGFALFIHYLIETQGKSRDYRSVMAIIGCLRAGKESGWLPEAQIDQFADALGGYDTLLSNQSGLLRSQTLRLIVLSSSTSLALSTPQLSLVKLHLDSLFAESDPHIRNEIYSALRILFERIIASSYALNKRLSALVARSQVLNQAGTDEIKQLQERLLQQKTFTSWFLNELLPTQLQPNSSYQRVVLALRVYSFWLPQTERDVGTSKPMSDLAADVKVSRKKQTDKEHIVLPFDPEIQYSQLLRLFVERLVDPYDDIRSLAAGLVKELRQSRDVPWLQVLQRAQQTIEDSGRPGQEDGFSRILEVLYDLSQQDPNIATEVSSSYNLSFEKESPDNVILDLIFAILDPNPDGQDQIKSGSPSRLDNSLLGALSLIYTRKDRHLLATDYTTLDHVLRISRNIWIQERAILCNESPEGRAVGSGPMGEDDSDDEEDQLNSQGFLSYSWRVVSESSSLLGIIANYAPKSFPEKSLAETFLRDCGELLIEQLISIRHRGSLSSIFPALTSVCFQCLISEPNSTQGLPQLWLDKLLGVASTSGKLITRRSAGLPMAIGAVIIAEVQTKKKQHIFLQHAFEAFQDTVHVSTGLPEAIHAEGGHLELPQVHALNCMRFLFMDSHLSDAIDPYVARSLKMAFACFKSEIWAVRNCGIMLYTAILKRIFPKDGSSQMFRGDRFFRKYAGLDSVFLETLSDGFQDLSDHRLIESVYPALDIISRLSFVENDELSESNPATAFKGLILRYLGCKIWKIREAAAKSMLAYTPSRDHALQLMADFVRLDPNNQPWDNNLVHGSLCASREIYERRLVDAEGSKFHSAICFNN
ncbi:hypothetical protein DRE_00289 [Drechslerella stenobrocha 248]|uniref:Uncharacterized protein n=1 Tax=Drechslerella stenobrocha 248 TaxID=1043628 RepID=W7HT95_9PEZI|nr:hypothetical protein DRE_00289 [Drechslerella stenobrocha 248]